MRRFMIAGTGSSSGKTTVTCAVLSALRHRGVGAASFKCGPDYIDPMFHRAVLDIPTHNLDSFFCNENMLRYQLASGAASAECAVLEGVMGFYDGARGSAYAVSEITETPVILVIDCKGMKESIGAVMAGFLNYKTPNRIAGFIFNRLPESLVPFVQSLCAELHTEYFGFLPQISISIESRHLGLVTADEIPNLQELTASLGRLAEEHLALDRMLTLDTPIPSYSAPEIPHFPQAPVIAVAHDAAFCFIYTENIEILQTMGCKLRYFSPLRDHHLPPADGLLLCGGYPELYSEQLSANRTMLDEIRQKINGGMPVIAECGGFLYLHDTLQTKTGAIYPMAGVIHGHASPAGRLSRFGYITMHADEDNLLCGAGETIRAHEFHYWASSEPGTAFSAVKQDGRSWQCAHVSDTMYAGFPHLYFPSDIRIAARFVRACVRFGETNGTN